MEYIIFDLEWDSVYYKPEKRFINQILQIGAVKLDADFCVIDTFEATVHSAISQKVTSRFSELTGITSEKMLSGIPYEQAVREYNRFANGAEITMTWSDSDLYTIVENDKLLDGTGLEFCMQYYFDLQKLVQAKMRTKGYDSKNQVSLKAAAEFFGIDTSEFEMHTALDDSKICAKLLKICYEQKVFETLLRDTRASNFKDRLSFKPYAISDINDSRIDKKYFEFKCPDCECNVRKLNKWKYRNRWFCASFKCPDCGQVLIGRVYAKVTFDSVVYKRRITKVKKRETTDELPTLPEKV